MQIIEAALIISQLQPRGSCGSFYVLLPSCSLQSTRHICRIPAICCNGGREVEEESEITLGPAPRLRRNGQRLLVRLLSDAVEGGSGDGTRLRQANRSAEASPAVRAQRCLQLENGP